MSMVGPVMCTIHNHSYINGPCPGCLATRIQFADPVSGLARTLEVKRELEAENARLKAELKEAKAAANDWEDSWNIVHKKLSAVEAELEALKPKPVVEVRYTAACMEYVADELTTFQEHGDNLKLTFTDGKLTGAEVIG